MSKINISKLQKYILDNQPLDLDKILNIRRRFHCSIDEIKITCGYFLKETDKLIVIVQSIRKLFLKEEGAYVDSVMKIPKVSVLKVSVLNQAIKIKNNKGRVKT